MSDEKFVKAIDSFAAFLLCLIFFHGFALIWGYEYKINWQIFISEAYLLLWCFLFSQSSKTTDQ